MKQKLHGVTFNVYCLSC